MRRLFLLVSAVVLVDTMFFAAVAPLLPHFSDELGLSKTAAGVLTAAYPAGTFVGAVPGGWLAARWGVKPTLLLGLSLLGVTSLVFAFANTIALLDAARFVQGIGGACMWAAGMAWLVSAAPADRRGELIGSALAAAIIGVLFGPVLGGAATVVGPEVVFSGVSVVAVGLAAWAWTTPGRATRAEPGRASGAARPRAARRARRLLAVHAARGLRRRASRCWCRCGSTTWARAAPRSAPIFLVAAAIEALISPMAGRLSDRRGRLAPIRAGLARGDGDGGAAAAAGHAWC